NKTYKEEGKLVFHNSLPFSSITDPRKIITCATHYGTYNFLMMNAGTAYVFRPDPARNLIKFYEYYLSVNSSDGGTIFEVEKKDIPNHYIKTLEELPNQIREEAPSEVIQKHEHLPY
ncbi:MAG: hypothetical protein HYT36_00695, partial [Candidatus Staskawiczbacteria bacterium]|nr:hypothetical protein [Candidatus Staskawiczbacteria bacterium]